MRLNTYKIIEGNHTGYLLTISQRQLELRHPKYSVVVATMPVSKIASLKLGDTRTINTGDTVANALLGVALAGPLGGAIAASSGGKQQACTFTLIIDDGSSYLCESNKLSYDVLLRLRFVTLADESKANSNNDTGRSFENGSTLAEVFTFNATDPLKLPMKQKAVLWAAAVAFGLIIIASIVGQH